MTALGVVRGLTEAGLRIPHDCSVMGFDDVLPARVATPAITTIQQPLIDMGHKAAERVLHEIDHRAGKGESAVSALALPETFGARLHSPSPSFKEQKV